MGGWVGGWVHARGGVEVVPPACCLERCRLASLSIHANSPSRLPYSPLKISTCPQTVPPALRIAVSKQFLQHAPICHHLLWEGGWVGGWTGVEGEGGCVHASRKQATLYKTPTCAFWRRSSVLSASSARARLTAASSRSCACAFGREKGGGGQGGADQGRSAARPQGAVSRHSAQSRMLALAEAVPEPNPPPPPPATHLCGGQLGVRRRGGAVRPCVCGSQLRLTCRPLTRPLLQLNRLLAQRILEAVVGGWLGR